VSVVRILIWGLADSKTSLDELRAKLPPLPDGAHWIANEPQERFGIVATGDEQLELDAVRTLIGKDPDVAEEYDLLET
jgi:hypothetical protein